MATTAKLSLAEYEKIVATGVFDGPNQRRIELIRGDLREMNPIGPDHATIVDRLNRWSLRNLSDDAILVRVQNPLALTAADSEPEPDVVWVRDKDYFKGHPTASDVLLVIEVAASSLDYDRTEKAELYANVGIREYWIVNLVDGAIEVFRDPVSGQYRTIRTFASSEVVAPLAAPEIGINFDRLLNRGS